MGLSDRRRVLRAKKKAAKEARMKGPKRRVKSKYALKKQGIYQPGSPYVTGNWGVRMKKLCGIPTVEHKPAGPSPTFLAAQERAIIYREVRHGQ